MPGKRISDLDVIAGAGTSNDDQLVIFDTDTSTTKRIIRSQLAAGIVGDLPYTPSGGISATTVPTAIAELDSEAAKSATLAAAGGAALIGNTPAGTIAATTVQGAIDEIVSDLAANSGSSLVGYTQGGASSVDRTVQAKLRETVSVKDFGAVGDGVTDDTAAIQAAIDTGKDVYVPEGNFLVTDTLDISTPYQSLFGSGEGSQITFTFASSKAGLAIVPTGVTSTESVSIRNLYLRGTANVSKLISIGGPLCVISENRLVNATSAGSVIYFEDEDSGNGIWCFAGRIINNRIYGSLTANATGIRTGLYCHASVIAFNTVENCGTLLYINGALTKLTVYGNILQRCLDSEYAVRIYRTGSSGQEIYAASFTDNYFEEVQKVFKLEDAAFTNINISNNYAYRNTATKTGSYFYEGGTGTSAASKEFIVKNNHIEDYDYVFNLTNEYSALQLDAKDNHLNSVNGYSTGTYASRAYKVRVVSPYFTRAIASGSFVSESRLRMEATSITYRIPLEVQTQEFIEKITFYYISSGSGTSTATIYCDGTSIGTVSTTGGTEGTYTITLDHSTYPQSRGGQYWAEFSITDSIAGYIYPVNIYTR